MTEALRLNRKTSFSGRGLHSGEVCEVTLGPSGDPGIFFALPGGLFPVQSAECDGSARGTVLTFPDGSVVRTVEHLLGVLSGLGVWSVEINVRGSEVPALDGSGAEFAGAIFEASIPGEKIEPIDISREIAFADPSRGGFISAIPSERFEVSYVINYEARGVGCQAYDGEITPPSFLKDIARARTFVLESEVKGIIERGLGKGGARENVLVIEDSAPPDPRELRLQDEPVRHKVLDLLGDLAILGLPLKGRVMAYRAGHGMHLELVRRIRRSISA